MFSCKETSTSAKSKLQKKHCATTQRYFVVILLKSIPHTIKFWFDLLICRCSIFIYLSFWLLQRHSHTEDALKQMEHLTIISYSFHYHMYLKWINTWIEGVDFQQLFLTGLEKPLLKLSVVSLHCVFICHCRRKNRGIEKVTNWKLEQCMSTYVKHSWTLTVLFYPLKIFIHAVKHTHLLVAMYCNEKAECILGSEEAQKDGNRNKFQFINIRLELIGLELNQSNISK